MKIAVIRKESGFRMGGAEKYCANLCRCLAELGHRVFLVACECDRDIHPNLLHVPVKVSNWSSSARNLSFHRNSQEALRNLDVDCAYGLSRTFPVDAFRISDPLHASWFDIRYTDRWRNMIERLNPRHRTILGLEQSICNPEHTRAIITNSKWSRQQLLNCYEYPEESVHVVYNGVDLDKFRPLQQVRPVDEKLKILFVAHDFKRKGLGFILDALRQLKAQGVACHLTVVGRDKPSPFRREAEKFGVSENIDFFEPSSRLEDYYNDSDLFVFPTLSDPFANVCLEALACGLPVMTTTHNGAAEILVEDKTGYVLEGSRPLASQIAAKVMRFSRLALEDRLEMRRQARLCAMGYTVLNNARQTLEVLTALTRPRQGR